MSLWRKRHGSVVEGERRRAGEADAHASARHMAIAAVLPKKIRYKRAGGATVGCGGGLAWRSLVCCHTCSYHGPSSCCSLQAWRSEDGSGEFYFY